MAARKINERMEYYTNVCKNSHYIRLEDNDYHLTWFLYVFLHVGKKKDSTSMPSAIPVKHVLATSCLLRIILVSLESFLI